MTALAVLGAGVADAETPWPCDLDPKRRREFGSVGRAACAAVAHAFTAAAIQIDDLNDPQEIGVAWGTRWGELESLVSCMRPPRSGSAPRPSPRRVPHGVLNAVAGAVSIAFGARGPLWTFIGAHPGSWALATAVLEARCSARPMYWIVGEGDLSEACAAGYVEAELSAAAVVLCASDKAGPGAFAEILQVQPPHRTPRDPNRETWSSAFVPWVRSLLGSEEPPRDTTRSEPAWQWRRFAP